MKLYDSRRAPNPRRVRWAMAEKGIDDIEVIDVDLFAGEHKTGEYLARAGMPNVPALTLESGVTITESIAICRYLEALYPEPNLFGRDAEEAAVIELMAPWGFDAAKALTALDTPARHVWSVVTSRDWSPTVWVALFMRCCVLVISSAVRAPA